MIILGIDPGTARVGWAVVKTDAGRPRALAYGCITTEKNDTPQARLFKIYKQCDALCKKYHPDRISLEELFYATNAKTVIAVSQARGVIILAAAQSGVPVVSYSPLFIKRAICGDGHADKKQVQYMITRELNLKSVPKPDDVADALAIALTHVFTHKLGELKAL